MALPAGTPRPRLRARMEGKAGALMPGRHEIIAQQLCGPFPLAVKPGSFSNSCLDLGLWCLAHCFARRWCQSMLVVLSP